VNGRDELPELRVVGARVVMSDGDGVERMGGTREGEAAYRGTGDHPSGMVKSGVEAATAGKGATCKGTGAWREGPAPGVDDASGDGDQSDQDIDGAGEAA
jgi:hypothetical protein